MKSPRLNGASEIITVMVIEEPGPSSTAVMLTVLLPDPENVHSIPFPWASISLAGLPSPSLSTDVSISQL